jgi:hypothetical protein
MLDEDHCKSLKHASLVAEMAMTEKSKERASRFSERLIPIADKLYMESSNHMSRTKQCLVRP